MARKHGAQCELAEGEQSTRHVHHQGCQGLCTRGSRGGSHSRTIGEGESLDATLRGFLWHISYLLDYTPPFLHRSSAKKKGGGRLIEVCTNAPSLCPPHPMQR